MVETNGWRPVVAALANPELRVLLAKLMLGEDVSADLAERAPSRRTRLRAGLLRSGLALEAEGALAFDGSALTAILASAATPRPTGVDRFIRDGRIDRYPMGADDRAELLAWAAAQTLAADEVISEREFNDRLGTVTGDVAALRRHLVDADLVERRRDGSEYALVTPTSR